MAHWLLAAVAVVALVQGTDLSGAYTPRDSPPGGVLTITAKTIGYASGASFETVTETSGVASDSLATGNPNFQLPEIAAEDRPAGYMEVRRIVRSRGDVTSLCGGTRPTHVMLVATAGGVAISLMRKGMFGTTMCGAAIYRRS